MYEMNITIAGGFSEVVEKTKAALMANQLGVVSEVNVQATLKNKLEKEIPAYTIFGACNPKLADELLEAEPNAGTLLPCTFIVREAGENQIVVSIMNPETVLGLASCEVAKEIGRIAKEKVQKVILLLQEAA